MWMRLNENKIQTLSLDVIKNLSKIRIIKEKPGVISKDYCWVCFCEGYLYTADTLEKLIYTINNEWEHDRHLVG